jgi:hypothetical protein
LRFGLDRAQHGGAGDSLRLIVLDRVPWATPTILERARKEAFGGNAYGDMVVRLRLRQAFGRLIRRAGDRGSFVILDSRLASRFTTAFPPGVPGRPGGGAKFGGRGVKQPPQTGRGTAGRVATGERDAARRGLPLTIADAKLT